MRVRLRFFSAGVDLDALRPPRQPRSTTSRRSGSSRRPARTSASSGTPRTRGSTPSAPRSPSPSPTSTRGAGSAPSCSASLPRWPRRTGSASFEAMVLPANYRMLGVFRDSGFPVVTHTGRDEIRVELPTSLTPEAVERFERREQIGRRQRAGPRPAPASVAVIGASRRRGHASAASRLPQPARRRLRGPVYPVNPTAERRPERARLPDRRGDPRPGRPGGDRRARPRCVAGGRRAVRAEGRARAGGALGRLRRGRARRAASASRRCCGCAATTGDAPDRPELHRRAEHRPDVRPERHVRPEHAAARPGRLRLAERRARAGRDPGGAPARHRHLQLRLDGQQGRHLGQRPAPVLGVRSDGPT